MSENFQLLVVLVVFFFAPMGVAVYFGNKHAPRWAYRKELRRRKHAMRMALTDARINNQAWREIQDEDDY